MYVLKITYVFVYNTRIYTFQLPDGARSRESFAQVGVVQDICLKSILNIQDSIFRILSQDTF